LVASTFWNHNQRCVQLPEIVETQSAKVFMLADLLPGHQAAATAGIWLASPQEPAPQAIDRFDEPRVDIQRHQMIDDRGCHHRLHKSHAPVLRQQLGLPECEFPCKLV
jgi:hypothetical protein